MYRDMFRRRQVGQDVPSSFDSILTLSYNHPMSIPQLLHSMCAELSDADLNVIRKARGFSVNETSSRSAFASFFSSSIGVAEAMQNLSVEEAVSLRLLHETGEVDIEFFERLYGSAAQPGKSYYGTYTQQYKSTLDAVKKNLVRKGLLVMAETKLRGDTVQMERWRFALPPEFALFLPPLLKQTRSSDPPISSHHPAISSGGQVQTGEISDHLIRKKLLQLTGAGPVVPDDGKIPIKISGGAIWLGEKPLSVETLRNWQMRALEIALRIFRPNLSASPDPVSATFSILGNLAPGEWVPAAALEPALKIYCFGGEVPPAEKILREGWELGLLARLVVDSVSLYRLPPESDPAASDAPLPASVSWLGPVSKANAVKIDLHLIPIEQLEILNVVTHLAVENGVVLASPNIVKLGRATPQQRASALSRWLAETVPAFGKAAQTVDAQWGKTIIHENLLFARVSDLSLRVQLERELKDKLLVLDEHFIAFPSEAHSSVKKVLKRGGFVIKTIKS